MKYRALDKSGLIVSRLRLGTLTSGSLQADISCTEAKYLLVHAWKNGISIFDAAKYSKNYEQIRCAGNGIDGMRIITKFHAHNRDIARISLGNVLDKTERSVIDVMTLHEREMEIDITWACASARVFL